MLHIALLELARRAKQYMLAQKRRLRMHERHGILKLVSISERPARLVEAAARPEPAGECLVDQPAVAQQVERLVRRIHVDCADRTFPERPDTGEGFACSKHGSPVRDLHSGFLRSAPSARAKPEDDFALLAIGQFKRNLDCAARVEAGAHAIRQSAAMQGCGVAQCSVAAHEFASVGAISDAASLHRLPGVKKCDPVAELCAIGVEGNNGTGLRIDLRDNVHRGFRAQVAQHPFDIARR